MPVDSPSRQIACSKIAGTKKGTYTKQPTKISNSKIVILNPVYTVKLYYPEDNSQQN